MTSANEGYKHGGGEEIQPIMVNVTAPSTLPAGYTFEAYLNDDKNRPFVCEVVCFFFTQYCIHFRNRSDSYCCLLILHAYYCSQSAG